MKSFGLLFLFLLSQVTHAMSFAPCTPEQSQAFQSVSAVPRSLTTFNMATLIASQVLWASSVSHERKDDGTKNSEKDSTLLWLMPSLGFELIVAFSFPRCSLMEVKDGKVLEEESTQAIKKNTRVGMGMSLIGQWVALTNTVDEDKRNITKTLMASTLAVHMLYEWVWDYNAPSTVSSIQPYLFQDVTGLQFVYRF